MKAIASYWRASRTPLYGFLAGSILFFLYEASIVLLNPSVRNGAEVWLVRLLPFAESVSVQVIKGLALLALGLLLLWRQRGIALKASYLGGMLLEATAYSLLLSRAVNFILQRLLVLMSPEGADALTQLTLSLGAGLYEELLFRALLFGGMVAVWKAFKPTVWPGALGAALLASLLFAAAHHVGPLGEPWDLTRFSYRFVSGLLFTGLYLARGFGITALTHALYDVWVVVGVL